MAFLKQVPLCAHLANQELIAFSQNLKLREYAKGQFVFEQGDLVGEFAVIDQQARSASARAIGKCALLQMSAETFLGHVREQPNLALGLMQYWSKKKSIEYEGGKLIILDLARVRQERHRRLDANLDQIDWYTRLSFARAASFLGRTRAATAGAGFCRSSCIRMASLQISYQSKEIPINLTSVYKYRVPHQEYSTSQPYFSGLQPGEYHA